MLNRALGESALNKVVTTSLYMIFEVIQALQAWTSFPIWWISELQNVFRRKTEHMHSTYITKDEHIKSLELSYWFS